MAINVLALDINMGCSGYIYSLEVARSLIVSGAATKILLATGDTYSRLINTEDRATRILFGDGAGAVLLEPSEEYGIIDSELKIDGSGGEYLKMEGGGSLHPASHETVDKKLHYVTQDGKTVFKYAVKGMADISYEVASRNNLSGRDIDLFIPHQANKRIIDATAKKLGLNESQVMINIEKYANTTAATIPICIAEAVQGNLLDYGDNVILSTFGAGFSWGATYLKWGMPVHA